MRSSSALRRDDRVCCLQCFEIAEQRFYDYTWKPADRWKEGEVEQKGSGKQLKTSVSGWLCVTTRPREGLLTMPHYRSCLDRFRATTHDSAARLRSGVSVWEAFAAAKVGRKS